MRNLGRGPNETLIKAKGMGVAMGRRAVETTLRNLAEQANAGVQGRELRLPPTDAFGAPPRLEEGGRGIT